MELSNTDKNTMKSLREMLLRDIDEFQYSQLKEFRDKLLDEIKRMNFAVERLEEQKRSVARVKDIMVASENDPLCAVFEMLEHNISREIDAIKPTGKLEKQLDIERRLATIQGKRRLAALLSTYPGIKD